jgi:hypothetical protein
MHADIYMNLCKDGEISLQKHEYMLAENETAAF